MAKRVASHHRGKRIDTWLIINLVLSLVYAALAFPLIYLLSLKQFLNFRYVNIFLIAFLAIFWLISIIFIARKKAKLFIAILLSLFILGSTGLLYVYKTASDLVENFNSAASYSEMEMSVVVAKDSPIKALSQLKEVQSPLQIDRKNIEFLLDRANTDKHILLKPVAADSYQTAYGVIMADHSKAMVLNSAYGSLLELKDEKYTSKIRVLYTCKISKKLAITKQSKTNIFNIYVSGIDSYGPISTVSRSDVNIIMTVNMDTHKILLTTTPRDAYVKIPGGGANQYDKLTHAGIYGVETSMQALANLYNTKIDYYTRINFTSFLKLIDVVGGIDVNNPHAFSAGKYNYPAGNIHLDSESALRFVRERHTLAGGDFDRGRNQERVIEALVKKLVSFRSVTKISAVITALQDSVQTNMSLADMLAVANTQLSSGGQFEVTSQDVSGTGSVGKLPSHAMPSSALYMLALDSNSVERAQRAISDTRQGK